MRKSYLFAFLDDMSRLVPHAEFYLQESLEIYLDCLRQALAKRGLPRRANALARGALVAAALEKAPLASADHVRKASSELIGSPMPSPLTDPLRSAAD